MPNNSWASHTGGGNSRRQGGGNRSSGANATPSSQSSLPNERLSLGAEKVYEVHIEGLVALKILKHCRDSFPEGAVGSLLGYERDDEKSGAFSGILEVSHCFPSLPENDIDDATTPYEQRYEVRMVKALKEINVDQSSVGWYTSNVLSSFSISAETVAHQAKYQMTVPSAVLVVYDNLKTSQGHLSLRAMRLSDAALAAYKNAQAEAVRNSRGVLMDEERLSKAVLSSDSFISVQPSTLFEELPVKIHNPHLIQALLVDLVDRKSLKPLPSRGVNGVATPTVFAGTTGGASVTVGGSLGKSFSVLPAAAAIAAALPQPNGAISSSNLTYPLSSTSVTSDNALQVEESSDFARLSLSTVPYLEKHLEVLNDLMTEVAKSQDTQAFVHRRTIRMQREKEEWIARRRRENADRQMQGLSLLPEEDLSLPFFQLQRDKALKDPLDSILYSAQINSYCSSVTKFSYQNFPKLYLAHTFLNGSKQ
jgi:translation initiation factor 3 subunit H